MEASDVFSGGVEISEDGDPFDGTDFGDFGDEAQAPEQPAEQLKTVDKEGNEVAPEQAAPAQPQDGASAESQEGQAAEPTGEVETAPPAAPAPAEAATEAKADPTPPGPAAESAGPTEAPAEPAPAEEPAGASAEQVEGDQGDPTPASSTPPAAEPTPAASSSGSSDEVEDAPLPEEPTDKSGRRTQRRYIILRVDGPGKFTQVDWFVDEAGKMSPTRKPGFRRQTVALARGAEDALKIGFAAVGAPQDGVKLVPVAALHFQPKTVKPKPPEPSKQRLSIS